MAPGKSTYVLIATGTCIDTYHLIQVVNLSANKVVLIGHFIFFLLYFQDKNQDEVAGCSQHFAML